MIKKIALVSAAALTTAAFAASAPASAAQNDLEICDDGQCWTLPTPELSCAEIADVAISHSIPPVDYTGHFNTWSNNTTYSARFYTGPGCTGNSRIIDSGSSGFGDVDAVSYSAW